MEEIIKSSKEIIRLYETEYDRKDLEQLVNESKEGLDKQGKEIVYKAMYYSFLMKIVDMLNEEAQREMNEQIDKSLNSGMNIVDAIKTAKEMLDRGGENFTYKSVSRDENGEREDEVVVKDGKIHRINRE